MTLGAVLAVVAYAAVSVLRARRRYLTWQRYWTPEKGALRALSLLSHKEPEHCDVHSSAVLAASTTIEFGDPLAGSLPSMAPGDTSEPVPSPYLYLVRP